MLSMSFCLYNKKNVTRRLEDMNFIFLWQKQYFTHLLRSFVNIFSPLKNKNHIFTPLCNILYIFLLPLNILRLQNPCIIIKRFISTFLDLVELIILHFLEQAMEVLLASAQLTPLSNQIIIIKFSPILKIYLNFVCSLSLQETSLMQENFHLEC